MKHPIIASLLSASLFFGASPLIAPDFSAPVFAKLSSTTGSLNLLTCDVLDGENNVVSSWDPAETYTIRMVFKSTGWLTHEAVSDSELKVGSVIESVEADIVKCDFTADAGEVKLMSAANNPFQIEVLFHHAKWQGPGNTLSYAITYPAAQKPGINGSIPITAIGGTSGEDNPAAPGVPEGGTEDTPSDYVEGWTEFSGDPNETIDTPQTPEQPKPAAAAPNLIISNYTYGGSSVQAGSTFNLSINFMNTSRAITVENIVMSLETSEGISIANSSNTFYFESLQPRYNLTQNIALRATGSENNSSPTIGVNFRYEYIDQNQRIECQRSEMIAIPVTQPERFEITEPSLPEMQVDMETVLSFPYVNKGKGTLYNVAVRTTGDIEPLQPVQNLGNFEAGRSGTIDVIFTPTHEGSTPFSIIVTYEDADGNEKQREFKYEPDVMGYPEAIMDPGFIEEPMDPEFSQEPGHGWLGWVIVLIVVAIAGGLLYWLKKKKKKNKTNQAEIDNEDIDWFAEKPAENETARTEKTEAQNNEPDRTVTEAKPETPAAEDHTDEVH